MRKVTRARSVATKQNILDAAMTEIKKSGFFKASLDSIAATAGLSKMSLYYHFETRIALCMEAVTNDVRQCAVELRRETEGIESSSEALEHAVEIIWKQFVNMGQSFHSLLDEMRQVDPAERQPFEAEITSYSTIIREIIRAGQNSGEIIPGSPSLLAQLFINAIGSTVPWYNAGGRVSPPQFLQLLKRSIPRLLTTDAPVPKKQRSQARKSPSPPAGN